MHGSDSKQRRFVLKAASEQRALLLTFQETCNSHHRSRRGRWPAKGGKVWCTHVVLLCGAVATRKPWKTIASWLANLVIWPTALGIWLADLVIWLAVLLTLSADLVIWLADSGICAHQHSCGNHLFALLAVLPSDEQTAYRCTGRHCSHIQATKNCIEQNVRAKTHLEYLRFRHHHLPYLAEPLTN